MELHVQSLAMIIYAVVLLDGREEVAKQISTVVSIYSERNIKIVPCFFCQGTCPINVCLNGGVCRMNNGVESCTCPAGYTGEICDMLIPTITPPITTSSTITPSTTLSSTITPSTTTYPTTTTSGSSQGSKETTTNYIQSKIHL